MAYNQIPFKTSRGICAYVEVAGVAGLPLGNIFPHKSGGGRTFPNFTCLISSFSEEQDNPGCWHVSILLSIRTTCTPGAQPGSEYASEALVGAIVDLFEDTVGDDRSALADAITAAGRGWAVDASGGVDDAQVAFAAANADMALFKVDSIKPLQGGTSTAEQAEKSVCWVDDFPFELVVRATEATEP